MRILFAVLALAWLLVFQFACSEDDQPPSVTDTKEGVGGGPGGEPVDETPVPGEYIPPSASREAQAKFDALLALEQAKPTFEGEVNGFRFVALRPDGSADITFPCEAADYQPADVLKFAYLPPGTEPTAEQTIALCSNGDIAFVNQEFLYRYGQIGITLRYASKTVISLSSMERVKQVEVNGRGGVIEEPLIPEGNGYSKVIFPLGDGFVAIEVTGLPAEQTLKIAEGVTCTGC